MTIHKPVLLEESLEKLNLKKGDTVVDTTLGGGGHSLEILKRILPKGKLIAIDKDKRAIENFKNRLKNLNIKAKAEDLKLVNDNFANLNSILNGLEISSVDAALADLGISSDQLEDAERGFSFMKEGPLDMRLSLRITNPNTNIPITNNDEELTAEDVVNNYSEEKLKKIFREYGEEKFAGRIAKKIVGVRANKRIKTTKDLVEVIAEAVPGEYKHGKIHFATRVFQALRIEVNDELGSLEKFIRAAIGLLKSGGRLAVISFHSGEDRIVKNLFKENARGCICPPEFPICRCGRKPKIKIITRKPIVPGSKEIKNNPRARSAKLRVAEKL